VVVRMAAYGKLDWERHMWCGRAATQGHNTHHFCSDVLDLLPSFKGEEHGRILHTAAPFVRAILDDAFDREFGFVFAADPVARLRAIVALHEAMLGRAQRAIARWSVVGRRCGVVKDSE
jgi:hypothetical protein